MECQTCGEPIPYDSHAGTRPRKYCSQSCAKRGRFRANTPEQFWSHVDQSGGPDACWPWVLGTGVRASRYRGLNYRGRLTNVHRHAWSIVNGPLPPAPGNVVRHTCDNPPCCNPRHLLIGTTQDNVADRQARGRTLTGRLSGSSHPHAKLTEALVRTIRERCAAGETQTAVAHDYGLHDAAVSLIVRRMRWAHVV